MDLLDGIDSMFTCPRCKQEVSERFYGPCTSCRNELRAALGGEAKVIVPAGGDFNAELRRSKQLRHRQGNHGKDVNGAWHCNEQSGLFAGRQHGD